MDLIFKALNDPARRAILDLLRVEDGRTLSDIEQKFAMTRFGVMAHLRVLEEAGLVVPRRVGRFKHHYLNAVPLQEVIDRWIEPLLAKPAALAALTLKTRLEGEAMTTARPDFVSETYIRCTQDALWRALTDPAEVAHYHFLAAGARGALTAPADTMEFLWLDGGTMMTTRVIAIDPKQRIEVSFEPSWNDDRAVSRCVYHIVPEGEACKLTIEHHAIPASQTGVRDGWARLVSGLKSHLESGAPARFAMAPAA